jgi:hypothetical protein
MMVSDSGLGCKINVADAVRWRAPEKVSRKPAIGKT